MVYPYIYLKYTSLLILCECHGVELNWLINYYIIAVRKQIISEIVISELPEEYFCFQEITIMDINTYHGLL